MVEHLLCDQEAVVSNCGGVILKTLKMVLAALSLDVQHYESRVRIDQSIVSMMYNVTELSHYVYGA